MTDNTANHIKHDLSLHSFNFFFLFLNSSLIVCFCPVSDFSEIVCKLNADVNHKVCLALYIPRICLVKFKLRQSVSYAT